MWHGFVSAGDWNDAISPLNGQLLQKTRVLSPQDLAALFQPAALLPTATDADIYAFATRFRAELQIMAHSLKEAMQWETAFSSADCDEMVEGTLQYLEGFADYYLEVKAPTPARLSYPSHGTCRKIALKTCPWGTIAVMLPQNALLLISVVCILNAFITGNRVALRSPPQSARTAALLGRAVWLADPPQGQVSIVLAKGREFLEAAYACETPTLVHYLGASQFGGDILKNAFENKKTALIDGSGNTWVWVGELSDPAQVAATLTAGATRYNGQTCTSINGAVIHPSLYDEVCAQLQEKWSEMHAGDTLLGAPIGGLFDEKQAQFCCDLIATSGGKVLCGGHRAGNLLAPTLIQNPSPQSDLVKEGIFGPVLWLRAGTEEDFVAQWPTNSYPLCAGVFDAPGKEEWWLARLPNIARLVFNGDPSIEHIYEPWGGYPGSGANSVSYWHQKYQRTVSLDALANNELT